MLTLVLAFASFALAQAEDEPVGRPISVETVLSVPPQAAPQVAPTQGYQIVPLSPGHVAVVENGAPANWRMLRWADDVLHSNPVRGRGIAPRYVHQGFVLNPLGERDPDGNLIDYYVTWTSGASGETVWIRVHPGESTEMRPTAETSTFTLNGEQVAVRAWIGGWFTRCANGTRVVNWQREASTIVRTVQGPERLVPQPYPVPGPIQYVPQPYPVAVPQYVFAPRRDVCVPETHTIVWYQPAAIDKFLPIAAAYAGAPRFSITATGGKASAEADAAAAAEAKAKAEATQQQQTGVVISGGGPPAN
jgi:hypothetical protein